MFALHVERNKGWFGLMSDAFKDLFAFIKGLEHGTERLYPYVCLLPKYLNTRLEAPKHSVGMIL